jgi:hypothetical protein
MIIIESLLTTYEASSNFLTVAVVSCLKSKNNHNQIYLANISEMHSKMKCSLNYIFKSLTTVIFVKDTLCINVTVTGETK